MRIQEEEVTFQAGKNKIHISLYSNNRFISLSLACSYALETFIQHLLINFYVININFRRERGEKCD